MILRVWDHDSPTGAGVGDHQQLRLFMDQAGSCLSPEAEDMLYGRR